MTDFTKPVILYYLQRAILPRFFLQTNYIASNQRVRSSHRVKSNQGTQIQLELWKLAVRAGMADN